ncbi:MAG: ribonuclease P [Candidatus Micrarchaeia archaeon]
MEKQKIAQERIEILFKLAQEEFDKHPERSKRYLELVDKIRTKVNLRLTKEQKNKYCKKCHTLWVKGKTLEIKKSAKDQPDIYICKICKHERKL